MSVDSVLIFGSTLLLILALGQLLVPRKRPANYWLCAVLVVTFLWSAHAVSYRLGAIDKFPHLNKIYLPSLCVTSLFWDKYIRSLFNSSAERRVEKRELLPALACALFSIPFYLQDETFKRQYIEVNVTDIPTATMYAASRLAELTLAFFLVRTLIFLHGMNTADNPQKRLDATQFLKFFTLIALFASIIRLTGSVAGSDTISVTVPTLIVISIFLGMHFLSYRIPAILSLERAGREIRSIPRGCVLLDTYRERLRTELWFLDPNLKIQQLARKLNTQPQELSALINTPSGMNYNKFINELRIEYAKTLLLSEPDSSVLDICYASGFNSKNTFNSCFKEYVSMTPTQFRGRVKKSAKESVHG